MFYSRAGCPKQARFCFQWCSRGHWPNWRDSWRCDGRHFWCPLQVGHEQWGQVGSMHSTGSSIYLSALAQGLQSASASGSTEPTRGQYADAANFALERLYTYTRARPPSRTLVDPLSAFIESLKDPDVRLDQAFEAAHRAAENTKSLPARAGRAAYVNVEAVKGTCDPGAWGIHCLLRGLLGEPSK